MMELYKWIIFTYRGTSLGRCFTFLVIGVILQAVHSTTSKVTDEFACFNTVFEIRCDANEVIVFDTARYGRNNTIVATRCNVPYERNCDVDVHFPLNRACAGKQACSLAVNTALFGDPCGYDEFLRVTYRCVQVATVQQTCFPYNGPTFYDHGYIASPNYPGKYYMDANCYWKLGVQKRQTLMVMLMDFELDVKKGGQCTDYLEISAGDRVYFKDCGSLGKQTIKIDSSRAVVRFHTGRASLAQRGFLIYFEANGPGCADLEDLDHGWANYFIDQDILYANVTCDEGFHFAGTGMRHQVLQCSGLYWNTVLMPCVSITPPTTPILITTTDFRNSTAAMDESGSLIGIALGVVSALLLITLLLVLALYFHKRRKTAERKLDQWRFVINNLQENSANEENHKRAMFRRDDLSPNLMSTPVSNVRKGVKRQKKNKKINNKEEEWQGRNLLTSPNYDDDDLLTLDARDVETMLKFPLSVTEDPPLCRHPQCNRPRNNSKVGKYSLGQSRDSHLGSRDNQLGGRDPVQLGGTMGNTFVCVDCDKPRPRDLRYKRAKSGQWDALGNKTLHVTHTAYPPPGALVKKQFTQSAPELIDCPLGPTMGSDTVENIFYCEGPILTGTPAVSHRPMERSSTITTVPTQYREKPEVPARRSSSRNKIRC